MFCCSLIYTGLCLRNHYIINRFSLSIKPWKLGFPGKILGIFRFLFFQTALKHLLFSHSLLIRMSRLWNNSNSLPQNTLLNQVRLLLFIVTTKVYICIALNALYTKHNTIYIYTWVLTIKKTTTTTKSNENIPKTNQIHIVKNKKTHLLN